MSPVYLFEGEICSMSISPTVSTNHVFNTDRSSAWACPRTSYTIENYHRLDTPELLRLIVRADRFCMPDCVHECAEALSPFAGYEDAKAYFSTMPEHLILDLTIWAIRTSATDALAAALGTLESLWRPAEVYIPNLWDKSWLFDERAVALPLEAVKHLLTSDSLLLNSENSAFSLAY